MDKSIHDQLFELFDVSDAQARQMSAHFVAEELKKGESFLACGERCDRLSFIRSGTLRVFVETETKEITQWIGGEGYFITDISSFMFDRPARWNIEALTPVRVLSLYKQDYQQFEQIVPHWNVFEKRFIAKCFMMLEERVFNFIALSAEERYQLYFKQNKALFNVVPLQYIASVLGMTPETLSRIRAKSSS